MIIIDGSYGEGGGQIVRSSLALSLVTGTSFRAENIRAGRRKPGLMRQHLTAIHAAREIGAAHVKGAEIGSQTLEFVPHGIQPGNFRFAVGTAGSVTLVLQTVLPALLSAKGRSELVLEGGTHNPWAPPFDFLERVFLPLIGRMGPRVGVAMERPGFYPAGGGCFKVSIDPVPMMEPIDLVERGNVQGQTARALVSRLPVTIAERELVVVKKTLGWNDDELVVEEIQNPRGPGNVLLCEVRCEFVTEVFTGFGERNVSSEAVATRATDEVLRYLKAGVPVGVHLADQLLVPLSIAGGGRFLTLTPTKHTRTNIEIIKRFLGVDITVTPAGEDIAEIELLRRSQ